MIAGGEPGGEVAKLRSELTAIALWDRRALAGHKVNIVAFQAARAEGSGLVRFLVDNPATARKALDHEGVDYQETEVVQIKRPSRPGELARAASRLGEADINIDYAYCGLGPSTSTL